MPPRKPKEVDDTPDTDTDAKAPEEKTPVRAAAPHRAPAKADPAPAKAAVVEAPPPPPPAPRVEAPPPPPPPAPPSQSREPGGRRRARGGSLRAPRPARAGLQRQIRAREARGDLPLQAPGIHDGRPPQVRPTGGHQGGHGPQEAGDHL